MIKIPKSPVVSDRAFFGDRYRGGLVMSVGLILEGGGNRGAYTAGVLDVLSENDIYIPDTYGVSAGACNAMSYLSKQRKRNYHIYMDYASDPRYSGIRLLMKTGSLFGFDFIFGELAETLLPFDFDEFERTSMKLHICATDVETGKPVFFSNRDVKMGDCRALIASASMPMVANIAELNGYKLLDGGITAPIPIDFAIKDGIQKNIVVLTRDRTFVKKDKPDVPLFLLKRKYKAYPNLIKAILDRPKIYNRERALCFEEQDKGNALLIVPSEPITRATGPVSSVFHRGQLPSAAVP